ncbi:hypothetical protein NLI96_g1728 [Meripilus lineatus]|uniref:Nucleoporin Nup54 alpha-helical domain-containing protein n=1 Tax=Meripilus lineatus TaxID=2056292 RepID=A0AAD5VA28_9APHY|nr:hypothetical protein NLI96_g1728 [Physisporinus lineatus]
MFGGAAQQQPQASTSTGGGLFGTFGANTQQSGGTVFGGSQPQTGGLFGGQTSQPQTGGSGLFGGQTNQAGTTGGGLFGSTQPQAQSGGLFGGQSTQQQPVGGGSLFGSTQQQPSQQQVQPSGGLFGGTQAQPTTAGGLFGNTQQQNTSGGLFGGAAQPGGAGGSSLFSSTSAQPPQSGGLFGNTNAGNTSSMFGGSSAAPAGSLFGSSTTGTQGSSSSLFGGSSQPATSGNLFGSQQPAQSTLTVPSLFGQPSQQAQQQKPPLFGSTFQSQPQQQQTSLFGSVQPSQPSTQLGGGSSLFGGGSLGASTLGSSTLGTSALGGSTLFGTTTNSLFSSKSPIGPSQQQADAQSQSAALMQKIEAVAQAWSPVSPQCRFQHYFYNLVDPAQVQQYGRPANATNDALWQKALNDNPDPSCLVPVVACGFDDLQQRVEAQAKLASEHQDRLKELKTRIEALTQRHEVSNISRLRRASMLQIQLTQRILRVVQHLHLLLPTLRSSAIRPEEEELRVALEKIDEEVRRPGGIGKLRGKLNELWALLGAVNAARERDRMNGGIEWAVVDEEGLGHIAKILAEEQAGLAHLTKILQKALKDLAVIQGVPAKEDSDTLTSTLRTSSAVY